MSTAKLTGSSSTTSNTPPSASARSGSVDADSWIEHFVEDGLEHIATAQPMTRVRWRDVRRPGTPEDVEAQQHEPEETLAEVLAAGPPPSAGVASPATARVDYEAGLQLTREDKRAMCIVLLSVLAFTLLVVIAMVTSGQQSKNAVWLLKHNNLSIANESLPTPTIALSTKSTSLLSTMQPSKTQTPSPTLTIDAPIVDTDLTSSPTSNVQLSTADAEDATVRTPTRSFDIPLTTPTSLTLTSDIESTVTRPAIESTSTMASSSDSSTKTPAPTPITTTERPSSATEPSPDFPGPSPATDAPPVSTAMSSVTPTTTEVAVASPLTAPSAVAASSTNVSAGWGGSLVMSTWTTPAKTVESTLNVVSSSITVQEPSATAADTFHGNPRPDRGPGLVLTSILNMIGDGLRQLGGH